MEPNWKPLVDKLGEERCVGFMFMGRVNGINLYKHGIARKYLNLDDSDSVTCAARRDASRKPILTPNSGSWKGFSRNSGDFEKRL